MTGDFAETMPPSDSLLWRIERDPVLRSTVTAVSLLDREPDFVHLRQRMLDAVPRIPRLSQRVQVPPFGLGSPRWVAAQDFDIDYHLRRVRLPPPATFQAALDFAAKEAMTAFDPCRPLWEFTVVEGVGDGAVLIQKFHHAVTDGVGGIRLALEILDTERHPPVTRLLGASPARLPASAGKDGADSTGAGQRTAAPGADRFARLAGTVATTAKHNASQAARLPFSLAKAALRTGRSPASTVRGLADSVLWGSRLLAPVTKPLSPIMTSRSLQLGFAAFDVDLPRLLEASHTAGGTLNDAFIAAVVAGLGRYHSEQGHSIEALRMTLPISIRNAEDPLAGNRFTPVRFAVPVGGDPAASIAAVSHLVHEWRHSPALGLTDSLAKVLDKLPTGVVTQVFGSMLRNVDFVATNVPGLPGRAYVAGAELLRQYAFAPPSGSAVNVALLTHAGHCCIGVNMDRAAVADADGLVGALRVGFEEVSTLATAASTPRAARRSRESQKVSVSTTNTKGMAS